MSRLAPIRLRRASSAPWSQVSELRGSSGGGAILSMMARWACSASCPSGRCSRIVNLVVRSTSVPIALLSRPPVMRSPSQWPGTARPSISGGRSEIMTMGSRKRGLRPWPPGGSPLPHGAFQLLPESAPGLQVDGLVDGFDARVHVTIIREHRLRSAGYLLRTPMPAQPGGDLVPQSRALGRLARSGAFEPAVRLLPGAAGLAIAGPGIPVALDLAADRAGAASRQPGDGADRIARAQPVGDRDALLLIEVARVDPFGFVHGGTIPVHACLFVPPGGAGAPVAPYLAGALGDPDRMGGLGEVHALLVRQTHVLLAPRRAHQLPRRIFDAVERPTAFPATVFVSVAPGHLTLPAVGQVLQRSLEPTPALDGARGWVSKMPCENSVRKRSKTMAFRCTPEDHKLICEMAAWSGMSRQDYIICQAHRYPGRDEALCKRSEGAEGLDGGTGKEVSGGLLRRAERVPAATHQAGDGILPGARRTG